LKKKDQKNNELSSQNEILTEQLEERESFSGRVKKEDISNQLGNENDEKLIYEFSEHLKNIETEIHQLFTDKYEYEFVNNRLYYYEKIENTNVYERFPTPTIVKTLTDNWNDILEIHYANNISYYELKDPKVTLYRNQDNTCFIILQIKNNKFGVIYGVNGHQIQIDRNNSFFIYEVSEKVGSFTDNTSRLIYIDWIGLYIVSATQNPLENIIETYNKDKEKDIINGKFNFKGSILSISSLNGNITINGKPFTEDNFFDNWIQEEQETEKQVSSHGGRIVIEKIKTIKTVLSTKQPKSKEILKKFYPPEGEYKGIYRNCFKNSTDWLKTFSNGINAKNYNQKTWLNYFISQRLRASRVMSQLECENLIKNGTFKNILSLFSNNDRNSNENYYNYDKSVCDVIAEQMMEKGYLNNFGEYSILYMISIATNQFTDPEFVKTLKPGFAKIEKNYKKTKESIIWVPFEIVRNL